MTVCHVSPLSMQLTMVEIEDLGSASLLKVQDLKITNLDHSPFWESFTWRFSESTSDNLGSVVDLTNIMETSVPIIHITKEVGITVALKFENCNLNVR
jgi:hypothetical protein